MCQWTSSVKTKSRKPKERKEGITVITDLSAVIMMSANKSINKPIRKEQTKQTDGKVMGGKDKREETEKKDGSRIRGGMNEKKERRQESRKGKRKKKELKE